MQPPDHILAAFTLFGSQYPSWKVSDDTLKSWTALTSDMDPKDLLRASIEHCRTSKWPPTVAEIRELSVRPSAASPSPEAAWAEVMGEIRRVGWCGAPKFSTPDIERAARSIGSWKTLCSQTTDQLAANRAHFYRAYEAMARTAKREEECVQIDGLLERARLTGAPMLQRGADIYGVPEHGFDDEG